MWFSNVKIKTKNSGGDYQVGFEITKYQTTKFHNIAPNIHILFPHICDVIIVNSTSYFFIAFLIIHLIELLTVTFTLYKYTSFYSSYDNKR